MHSIRLSTCNPVEALLEYVIDDSAFNVLAVPEPVIILLSALLFIVVVDGGGGGGLEGICYLIFLFLFDFLC